MMVVLAGGQGGLLASTDFWVAASFVAFVGLMVYYGVPGMVGKALDQRADSIRKELDDARRLREEAQQLLADYQRKGLEAESEAKSIVENARREAEALAAETRKSLNESLARRTRIAEEKIARAEAQAPGEVRSAAVDAAILAAERVLGEKAQGATSDRLIADGIESVRKRLN